MLHIHTFNDVSLLPWRPEWVFKDFEFHPFGIGLYMKNGEYIVKAKVLGLRKKELKVTLEGNTLTIEGKRKGKKEVSSMNFYRTIGLPGGVGSGNLKAVLKGEILEVRIPREKPRTVEIQALKGSNGHRQ